MNSNKTDNINCTAKIGVDKDNNVFLSLGV